MRRKNVVGRICCFAAVFTVFFFLSAAFLEISEKRYDAPVRGIGSDNPADPEALLETYDIRFDMSEESFSSMDLLMPAYVSLSMEEAAEIAHRSGFTSVGTDCGDYFRFMRGDEALEVHKDISYVEYWRGEDLPKAHGSAGGSDTIVAEGRGIDEAARAARGFVDEFLPYIVYREYIAEESENGFSVTFYGDINGVVNYGFPVTVLVDPHCAVYCAKAYYFEYECIDTCPAKSAADAFWELPPDGVDLGGDHTGNGDKPVTLTDARLVYVYENSILQPAYVFTGETPDMGAFVYYVSAASFGER